MTVVEGFYSITFRGQADFGMGLLILKSGQVVGCDIAGVKYDGTYIEAGDSIAFTITMTVPPGVSLVQGTAPKSAEFYVPINATVLKADVFSSKPVLLQLPPGPVYVIFQKLRGLS